MALQKLTYTDGITVIPASNLNAIQDAIIALESEPALVIDSELSESSTNPVQNKVISGAISETNSEVSDLKRQFDEVTTEGATAETLDTNTNLATTLKRGYYTTSGGAMTFNNNASFSHMKVNVVPGKKYQINKTHNTYTMAQMSSLGVFVDANGDYINTIKNVYGSLPSAEPYDIVAPTGAAQMYLTTDYVYTASPVETTVYAYGEISTTLLDSSKLDTQPVYYSELSDTGTKIKIIAGVIRNTGSGWQYINNSGHEPLNLSSVSVNNEGQLVINYGFTASKVLSLVVCPDETFAQKYTCGASVGVSNSVINIYTIPKSIGGMVHYNSSTETWVYANNSNFTGASFANNGNLTLSHEDLTGYPLPDIYSVSADGNKGNVQIVSVGYTSVIVKLFDENGNAITNPIDNTSVYVIRHLNSRFINASDVISASGNLWIYGVMKID